MENFSNAKRTESVELFGQNLFWASFGLKIEISIIIVRRRCKKRNIDNSLNLNKNIFEYE